MLIRCSKCGRPLYLPREPYGVPCPYCYQLNTSPYTGVSADRLDWEQYFLRLAEEKKDFGRAMSVLDWLGDSVRAAELRGRLTEKEERRVADILARAEAVIGEAEFRSQLIPVFSMLESVPEGEKRKALSETLEKRFAEMQLKEEREEAEKLLRQVRGIGPDSFPSLERAVQETDRIIGQARKLGSLPAPEADALLREAAARKAELEEALEKAREERRRKERRRKKIRLITALAALVLLAGYWTVSTLFTQPAALREARQYAAAGDYEKAGSLYEGLSARRVIVNPGVRSDAEKELEQLRLKWAGTLYAGGDYPGAIRQYDLAGAAEEAGRLRTEYGDLLAERERYEEAAALWEASGSKDAPQRLRQLYALLAGQLYCQQNYREALNAASRTDDAELKKAGVTRFLILTKLCGLLAREGDFDGAFQYCEKAEELADTPARRRIASQARTDIAVAQGRQAVDGWLKAGADPARLETLAKTGKTFRNPDHQLRYWKILEEAGVDVSAVYPDGVAVDWAGPPAEWAGKAEASADLSRPVAVRRVEKDYMLSLFDLTRKELPPDHDPDDSGNYTVTLLPSLWQALAPERRPGSLSECSCVLWADLTYSRSGTVFGQVQYQYDENAAYNLTSGGKRRTAPRIRTVTVGKRFPTYLAEMKILGWDLRKNAAVLLERKTDHPVYSGVTTSVVMSWSTDSSVYKNISSTGLSGHFDRTWVWERLSLAAGVSLQEGGAE